MAVGEGVAHWRWRLSLIDAQFLETPWYRSRQMARHLQCEGYVAGRKRILLVKKREFNRLMGAVDREGRTLVPLELYFGPTGMAKIKLALATGRKAPDKRDVEKKRDWDRQKGRILRDRG